MQDTRNNDLVMLSDSIFEEHLTGTAKMKATKKAGIEAGIPEEHQGAVFQKGEVVTIKGMDFVIHEVRSARMVLHPKK